MHDWIRNAGIKANDIPASAWRMRASLTLEAAVSGYRVILASADAVDLDVNAGRLIQVSDVSLDVGRYYMMFGEGALRRRSVREFRGWLLDVSAHLRT